MANEHGVVKETAVVGHSCSGKKLGNEEVTYDWSFRAEICKGKLMVCMCMCVLFSFPLGLQAFIFEF